MNARLNLQNTIQKTVKYQNSKILGDTKAPNKMEEGSVYNLIEKLDPEDLSRDKLVAVTKLTVCDTAKKILDHAINLASIWKTERKGKRSVHFILNS